MFKHLAVPVLLACLLSASCGKNKVPFQKSYPLSVTGRVYGYLQSDPGTPCNGERIGVYMSGRSSEAPEYSNLGYTASEGPFHPDDMDLVPCFPADGNEKWDVFAYCPYRSDFDGNFGISVSDQSSLTARTLLYASAGGLDRHDRVAVLRLAPVLSRIVFRFKAGEGIDSESLGGIEAALKGVPSSGSFNVVSSEFTLSRETGNTIAMIRETPGDAACVTSAFVIPHADTEGCCAEIQVPGEGASREFDVGGLVAGFAPGVEYSMDITINRDDMDIRVTSGPIDGWKPGGDIYVEGEEKR